LPARIIAQEQPPEQPEQPEAQEQQPDATPDAQPEQQPDAGAAPAQAGKSQQSAADSDSQPSGAQPAAPSPGLPTWPVNEKPGQPTITWDSHGLRIQAANSSLDQILKQVCAATGSTVEGMNKDERVFGLYGPGQARDVLSELLLGAGYNVIMVGDQGQGAPRRIVLSARRPGGQQKNSSGSSSGDDDADADAADDQPVDQPIRPAFPARNPQQRMEEMRLRQQMIQQQIQQNQQSQPPNN